MSFRCLDSCLNYLNFVNVRSRSSLTTVAMSFRSVDNIILDIGIITTVRMKIEPTVFSLNEYSQFLDIIQDELRLFRERQAEASSLQEMRQVSQFLLFQLPYLMAKKKFKQRKDTFSRMARFQKSIQSGRQ